MKRQYAISGLSVVAAILVSTTGEAADKLTFHSDPARTGSNPDETVLTPATVGSSSFGQLWQSPPLDPAPGGVPARLFASPLYLSRYTFPSGPHQGMTVPVAFVTTSSGFAYAISAGETDMAGLPPGSIIWRKRLSDAPCGNGTIGNLSTPVIDRTRQTLYVTSCSGSDWAWQVHALDLATGQERPGWPVAVDAAAVNQPGMNRNGSTRWIDGQVVLQRGALNLNSSGTRLYIAFGPDQQGWLLSMDTLTGRLAGAFSSMPSQEQEQGGMWGASGPSVDAEGRIHIATGANFGYTLANRGIAGVFPESPHSWGQSILQFRDDGPQGLRLSGTYSPYNYCQTAASDIDIGGSGAVLLDVTGTDGALHRLLALGGGKQGNAYLLDRDRMPGGTFRRPPCSTDPETDTSLLAPEVQPALGARGPVNVFGPFSDSIGMANQAKSRSTIAWLHDAQGHDWLYLTGSAKTGSDYSVNVPPGLVRLRVVTDEGAAPFLRIEQQEMTVTLQNPGSPVVSSNRGRDAIVWVLDPAAPRSFDIFRPDAPGAMLYAFDAVTLRLLWTSGTALFPTGKYNEPAVVDGMVLVGTDRLQAFGLATGPLPHLPAPGLVGGTAGLAAPMADAVAASLLGQGRDLFTQACSACHTSGAGGAPALDALAGMPRERIVEALRTGKMAQVASNLTAVQVEALATYLTSPR